MKLLYLLAPATLAFSLAACSTNSAIAGQGPQPIARPGGSSGDLAAFPPARAGQKRHVINLPAQKDEDLLKVELIVGKTMMVDCNNHMFGGQIEQRTAQGWGYDYYVLERLGEAASTLMGCPSGSQHNAFVRSSHQELVRYNSRLPLVVYTPADVELRYRVWRADVEQQVVAAPADRGA